MAEVSEELLALEKGFRTGDEPYYIRHVDRDCLVAFSEMAGAMSNTAIAATVKDASRWRELTIEPVGAVDLQREGHASERRALCGASQ
jgi:hypothetical protein